MPLSEEMAARIIHVVTEQAWNQSRPHPSEAEFDQMTELFQQRIRDFSYALIVQLATRNIIQGS